MTTRKLTALTAAALLVLPAAAHAAPARAWLSPLDTLTVPAGKPRAYMLLVHGGGFILTGIVDNGAWWNQHGWATYSIDYRPGRLSVTDTIAAYDHLRRQIGPRATICADGQSAGGTLVMLLAAARPSLDCVISEAGIVDLPAMSRECAYGNVCGGVSQWALWAFGPRGLWRYSPARVARCIRQPLLMGGSSYDSVIDEPAQLREMARLRPSTFTMLLAGAATPVNEWPNFMHASVRPTALARFQRAELRMADGVASTRRRRASSPPRSICSGLP